MLKTVTKTDIKIEMINQRENPLESLSYATKKKNLRKLDSIYLPYIIL
jgi:hypothetical protein